MTADRAEQSTRRLLPIAPSYPSHHIHVGVVVGASSERGGLMAVRLAWLLAQQLANTGARLWIGSASAGAAAGRIASDVAYST